jgi:anaerobic magnesium-protoporphyrin IX monomethyl ester cyclase
MKIAFVYIDPSYKHMGPFHVGIASLIAFLRRGGHECLFFHMLGDTSKEEYVEFLKKTQPDIAAFSLITNAFPHLAPMTALTKMHSNARVICGGAHPMLYPEEVIKIDGVDMVGIGEGEGVLLDLCDRLQSGSDISDIPNLWLKRGDDIVRNSLRPLIDDLDTLPFPDREVLPFSNSFDLNFMKRGVFMASRGCPFNCAYCCSPAMKRMYGGEKYIRFRSVDNLIEEVERVTKDFPQSEYHVFHDDLLPMNKDWFAEFTRQYSRRIRKPFEMNCHPNLMDKDIAVMAKSAGCALIRFGIESGNERLRRDVLDRHVTNKRICDAFRFCDDVGIKTLSYNMIGLPHETRKQMLDTIKLNAEVKPRVLHVSIFYPYPGTMSFEMCKREGMLTDKYIDSYYEDSVLEQPCTSAGQVRAMKDRFEPLVRTYSRCRDVPAPFDKVGEKIIDLEVLAATDQRVLRLKDKFSRKKAPGERISGGTCYAVHGGEVRVWEDQ